MSMEIPKPDPLPVQTECAAKPMLVDLKLIQRIEGRHSRRAQRLRRWHGSPPARVGGALAPRGGGPSDLHGSRLLLEPGPRSWGYVDLSATMTSSASKPSTLNVAWHRRSRSLRWWIGPCSGAQPARLPASPLPQHLRADPAPPQCHRHRACRALRDGGDPHGRRLHRPGLVDNPARWIRVHA